MHRVCVCTLLCRGLGHPIFLHEYCLVYKKMLSSVFVLQYKSAILYVCVCVHYQVMTLVACLSVLCSYLMISRTFFSVDASWQAWREKKEE